MKGQGASTRHGRVAVWIPTVLSLVMASAYGPHIAEAATEGEQQMFIWPDRESGPEFGGTGRFVPREESKPSGVDRLTDVTNPSLTVYRPEHAMGPTPAVMVCPGGGYNILALDKEGTEICAWLNSAGFTAILLAYTVPNDRAAALRDAQRAMGLIRRNAEAWNLDPHRLGVIGFSAGGHLCAALSTCADGRTYEPIDEADALSCRPDFTVLVYPAYLVEERNRIPRELTTAPELKITSNTPPTLLIQTQDDTIRVENSLYYYHALTEAKVPAELHLYAKGGHGYGLRESEHAVVEWPKRCERWFKTLGITE